MKRKIFLVAISVLLVLVASLKFQYSPGLSTDEYVPPYYVEQVADIAGGALGSNPAWFTEVNGNLYFQASDGVHGIELWKYSPYTLEASMVTDIYEGANSSNPEWLTVIGDTIYFAATDAGHGRQIWSHNVVTGKTELVVEQSTNADPKWLTPNWPLLYFTADVAEADPADQKGRELYAFNITNNQVKLVKDIRPGTSDSDPQYLYGYGQLLIFTADDGDNGEEFWRSDGTTKGTYMVKDIWPGDKGSEPSSFNLLGHQFIFSADDGKSGRELWSSFATSGTTSMIKDIFEGKSASDPGWSNRLGESVVFFPAKSPEYGNELWRYDKQYGAYLLADINEGKGDSNPAAIGDVGWVMFFSANDGITGVELWETEPPYLHARQVTDINPGRPSSNPKSLGRLGTSLFFTAEDKEHGEEVWVSETPYYAAHLLKDIRPGKKGSIPNFNIGGFTNTLANSIRIGWTIYFTANDGKTGVELWQVSTGALPQTGFAPGVKTQLPAEISRPRYQSMSLLGLEIPKLNKSLSIVGVPKEGNTWNVDWLGPKEVGYLTGTAFPTWPGNTALSGHVYLPDGSPGPFVDLKKLSWNDAIIIHAWGQDYIYKVRKVDEWVDPNAKEVLEHKEYDWLTLITCQGYDEERDYYRWRIVVQAVLVEVVRSHP